MGTEIFPDANAPLLRIRLRAPSGTRVEETERIVLRALDVIQREAGPDNVEITSDFVGVVPSSYPVDLIHLFTSGPQEAIIQVALEAGCAARRSACASDCGPACAKELAGIPNLVRSRRHRQPGDELRIAHADRGGRAGRQPAGRLRLRAKDPGSDGAASIPARSSVCPGTQLSDAGHQHRSRARRAVRPDDGRRGPLRRSGHIVVAIHAAELLARSQLRQCLSDSGGTAAEPDAERRRAWQHPGDAEWPRRDRGWTTSRR